MSRKELRDGYVRLMSELYDPVAYLDRLDSLYLEARIKLDRGWHEYVARRPWRGRLRQIRMWAEAFGLMGGLAFAVPDRLLRPNTAAGSGARCGAVPRPPS